MLRYLVILSVVLSLSYESTALNKEHGPDDPLLHMFRKQEFLLQKIGKQLNDSIRWLDTKITVQTTKLEHALSSQGYAARIFIMKETRRVMEHFKNLVEDKLCPHGFYLNDFGCYKFIYEDLTYDNAAARCRLYASHLVEAQTREKYEALISLMDQRGALREHFYHLGGKKVNSIWTWAASKTPFSFTNWWKDGEDVLECAQFKYYPGREHHKKWDDDTCAYKAYSVCET